MQYHIYSYLVEVEHIQLFSHAFHGQNFELTVSPLKHKS